MKHLFTTLAILLSFQSFSQCYTKDSTQTVYTSSVNSNTNFTGNVYVIDDISGSNVFNSVNFNNWDKLSFYTPDTMKITSTINMNGNKKLILEGKYRINNITMSGNDTIYLKGTGYFNITANNSGNTVVLVNSAVLTNALPNNVAIAYCGGTPLPINILTFKYTEGYLVWEVLKSNSIELEYSTDGSNWEYYKNVSSKDRLKVESGYYRLKITGEEFNELSYSTVVKVGKPKDIQKYYYDIKGNRINGPLKEYMCIECINDDCKLIYQMSR